MNADRIRPALPHELPLLNELERAAGQRFRALGMAAIADAAPLDLAVLAAAQQRGQLWVIDLATLPVGFVMVEVVDAMIHIAELTVHPDHGQRGLGRRLLEWVCAYAREQGWAAVTLSTFRAVPWNGPWYARCGFVELPEDRLNPGLRAIRAAEAQAGLAIEQRMLMRRDV